MSRVFLRLLTIVVAGICLGEAVYNGMTGHAGTTAVMATLAFINLGMYVFCCLPQDIDEDKPSRAKLDYYTR